MEMEQNPPCPTSPFGAKVGSVIDSQQFERPVVGAGGVERVQNASEDRVFWLDSGKQGGAGAELEVVG